MLYYFKYIKKDELELLTLLAKLGIIKFEDNGKYYEVYVTDGGSWVQADSIEIDKIVYEVAMLKSSFNIEEVVADLAKKDPEMDVFLKNFSRFFYTDANGKPIIPEEPPVIFL